MAFAQSSKAQFVPLTPIEKDYYGILGLTSTSTPEQIKEAYRKLVKKYHPDSRVVSKTDEH